MTCRHGAFSVDETGFIQTAHARVLAAAAKGALDLNHLARAELANRGLDRDGRWVGFERARSCLVAAGRAEGPEPPPLEGFVMVSAAHGGRALAQGSHACQQRWTWDPFRVLCWRARRSVRASLCWYEEDRPFVMRAADWWQVRDALRDAQRALRR